MKIYLDINQFGTPHWLGELARIDPTTIREYNKQQWINAMKAKTEAAYAARKVRVLGDANPYHEPAGSPKGGQFARAPGAKEAWIREKVDQVANVLKFPKDRIHMSTGTYMFELNGNQYRAGGIAIYNDDGFTQPDTGEKFGKGDIVIYGNKEKGFEEDMPIRGLVAHEIQHQIFNQVIDKRSEEFAHAYNHNPDIVDTKNYVIKPEVLEEYKGTYPVTHALDSLGWDTDALNNKLEEEDGVTWYSKQYWDQASAEKPGSRKLAINETLAEIASLVEEGEARIWNKDTGNQMTEHLRGWLKTQYEKDGSSFADSEEHKSQMEDPWAYSEMMQDTDGDDEFRKKFGTKIYNIKGFKHNGDPIYHRPIWTDYPDPVISPTWKKVFDAFRTSYRKSNNITDAGFDEDQPRDDEGQWTSGGPVKLKLGGKMRTLSRNDWASTKATLDLFKGAYMNPINDQEIVWAWNGKTDKDQRLAFVEFGPAHDEETLYLKHIRTFPQREGAGRLAMEKVMKHAGEKGMGIYLDVARNSSTPYRALRKFYTGLGFKGKGDSLIWRP